MNKDDLFKIAAEKFPMHLDYQNVWVSGVMYATEALKDNEFTVVDLNMAINLSRHINHTVWETKQNDIIQQIKNLKYENKSRDS